MAGLWLPGIPPGLWATFSEAICEWTGLYVDPLLVPMRTAARPRLQRALRWLDWTFPGRTPSSGAAWSPLGLSIQGLGPLSEAFLILSVPQALEGPGTRASGCSC